MPDLRCDACRFWEPPEMDAIDAIRFQFGRCGRIPHAADVLDYAEIKGGAESFIRPEFSDRLAVAYDAEDYFAEVYTAPLFFCAMWAARQSSESDGVGRSDDALKGTEPTV